MCKWFLVIVAVQIHNSLLRLSSSFGRARARTPIRAPVPPRAKMADEEEQQFENAFDILVSITEKSGNLRKDPSKTFYNP